MITGYTHFGICDYPKVLTRGVLYLVGYVLVRGQTMGKGLVDFMHVIAMNQQNKRVW